MVRIYKTVFTCFSILLFLICHNAYATNPVQRLAITKDAEIVGVKGDGWVRFIREKDWSDAVRQQVLTAGDTLKTGIFGKMNILFIDDMQITMHNRTTLVIKEVRRTPQQKQSVLGLETGEIWSRAKTVPEGLKIETPSATAAIRGTDLNIAVDEKGTSYLTVLRGFVELYNDYGKILVGPGEQGSAEIGKPPIKSILMRPKDRVQWMVSYHLDVVKLIPFYSYRRQEVLKALPAAREATEKDPRDLRSKLMLAGLLFDLKEKKESLKLLDEVLEADPKNPRALTFKGLLELDKGKIDLAETCFKQALQVSGKGENSEPLIGMFGVHLQKNQIKNAEELIEEMNRTRPSPLTDLVTGVFQAYQGNFEKAISLCKSYAKKYPDQEIFPTFIAIFYLILDNSEQAKEWIDKAAAINPDFAHVHAFLGMYYYINGQGIEAEAALKKSLEIDPKNDIALNTLGLVMNDKGNYEEALRIFTETIDIYPRDALYWANRGVVFSGIGNMEKAREDYRIAAELDPGNFETFKGLGYVALSEGKTNEAIQYLLKSSLMEPQYANPHIYLAIAYYQQGDIERALDELKLAEQLDPRDPLPHMIALIIYQDIYRSFDAVQEATKALELLPYLKSVVPIENTRNALADFGSALLNFNLSEWAWSYSQESYDPHSANSHFFAARQYADNLVISISEAIIGLVLDPLSVSSPNRYQDIIRKPRHDATFSAQIGSEDGGFSQSYDATFQGYSRKPFDVSYYLSLSKFDKDGFRENGYSEGNTVFYGLGIKPDYKNGFFTYGWTIENKAGEPGTVANPDPDDREEQRGAHVSLGYYHRFGYKNDLLARFAYQKLESEFINPFPYGTGLSDIVLSFMQMFGLPETQRFFQKGVYDITEIIGGPNMSFATDSSGVFADAGLSPLTDTVPRSVDDNPLRVYDSEDKVLAFQTRHLFDIGYDHQVTYGVEYVPDKMSTSVSYNSLNSTGTIDFCDELLSETVSCSTFSRYTAARGAISMSDKLKFLTAYIYDRWSPSEYILIEGGIFYESLEKENDYQGIHPRIGVALRHRNHILRLGFQKWLQPSLAGTLAPISTAGLVVDSRLALSGSRLNDYQARLESRWSERFFTAMSAERLELKDTADPLAPILKGRTNSLSFAVNSILTKNTGVFLRYIYTDSRNESGENRGNDIALMPQHALSGGIIWVSPHYIKSGLSASYIGRRYSDRENRDLLSEYVTADFSLMWEPFRKHAFFNLSVSNIFDERYETSKGYPAAGRSVYLTAQYRF